MTRVSLIQCREYKRGALKKSIRDSLNNIDFDYQSLKGAKVGLKASLMMPAKVEKAITTHPEFLRAVAEIVMDNGGKPVLTECPGYTHQHKILKKIGYDEIVGKLGIEVPDMTPLAPLRFEGAKILKTIEISKTFMDVDIIINLPKLKTHGLMYITGSVKNLLGVIPGLKKSRIHLRAPEKKEFAELLLDLYGILLHGFENPKTIIHLMDAIIGQEGEGPGPAGKPKTIGAIIAGTDGVAVDYVAAKVLGFDINKVPTIPEGFKRSYCVSSPDDINVVGEKIEDLALNDFTPTRSTLPSHVMRGPIIGPTARNLLMERPIPSPEKCTKCYNCKIMCASGAIEESGNRKKIPEFNYRKCIRCLCCIEVCPEAAISLRRGRLQWLHEII